MTSTITRLHLDNGLLVLLKEIHTAPIISQWIWYKVGSRDEVPGKTGISHWTEHMQFKGTERFPAGVLDRAIARMGGSWNASTYLDWTTYYEVLPAEKIDLALELEADRMINSLFTEKDVESERTVIISERQGSENEPLFRLGEEVQAAAFRVHSYHHDVVGDMADLLTINRQDLYDHYRRYYHPGNAVLTLAGDFETGPMLERIKSLFGAIPAGSPPLRLQRPEPDQPGERIVKVEGPGETTYLEIVYRTPQTNHPDFLPFTVLDSLLTGASSINMFGGGISNKTSRLYRALVEGELAVGMSGGLPATIDPYLYNISVTLRPDIHAAQVLESVETEIRRLQEAPPPDDEVLRAVKQARALFAYGSESITNQACWLGFAEMYAEYDWFTNYLENLTKVTAEDIQRVAQKYLQSKQRVVGEYIPTGSESDEEIMDEGEEDFMESEE